MKFDKNLERAKSLLGQWSDKWIEYSQLKALIYAIPPRPLAAPITDEAELLQSAGSAMADGDEQTKLVRELSGSPQELEFFKKLQQDVHKVSSHYQAQEALLLATYRQTIAAVEAFCEKYIISSRIGIDPITLESARQREYLMLQTSIVRLFSALIQLENYAHLNYEGIGKALKKHDKITGRKCKMRYMAVVNSQSWAQYSVLLQMLSATEDAYKLLTTLQQQTLSSNQIR